MRKHKREYPYKDVIIRLRRNKSQWGWEMISGANSHKPVVTATGGGCKNKNDAHAAAVKHYEAAKLQ